jgi:hypothetical protein
MNTILEILAVSGILLVIGVCGEIYFGGRDNNERDNKE